MLRPGDADAVAGARLHGTGLRRVWEFARPYRRSIYGFLAAIVAAALLAALELDAGSALVAGGLPEPGERLQDILDPLFVPRIDVRDSFGFWLDAEAAKNPEAVKAVEEGKEELAASSLDAQFNSLEDVGELTEVEARLAELKAGGAPAQAAIDAPTAPYTP